ncbi:MAG: hypothetical protein ABI618_20310, partial [Nitrospirota bacterium]
HPVPLALSGDYPPWGHMKSDRAAIRKMNDCLNLIERNGSTCLPVLFDNIFTIRKEDRDTLSAGH